MLIEARAPHAAQSIQASAAGTRRTAAEELFVIALGSLAIGILAQLSLPIGPVPLSGQTLAVLGIGALLGSRRGALAVLAYLAEGAAGLPVFAGGASSIVVLAGPTGGYLSGFVIAAFLTGFAYERTTNETLRLGALAGATVAVYAVGAAWLGHFVGWRNVFALGVAPFVAGDAIKIGIVWVAFGRSGRRRGLRVPRPTRGRSAEPQA